MTLQEGTSGSQYLVEKTELPVELERRLEALGLMSVMACSLFTAAAASWRISSSM